MRYLLIVPELGFTPAGEILPGGLQQHGRCVARALASSPSLAKLGIWCQVDSPGTAPLIERMVRVQAHAALKLDIRGFGGSRVALVAATALACLRRSYDRVFYLLVNQAVLSALPWHPPYVVWEIGRELFQLVSRWKYRALRGADFLLSSTQNTTVAAAAYNPGLPAARVVPLCVEPPLFEPAPADGALPVVLYEPAQREPAVLIVANMHRGLLYKGHRELIAAWPEVVASCPEAELWMVGDGSGRPELEALAAALPPAAARRIRFWGRVDEAELDKLYRRGRVFAMPSTREGFGLVFVEAARYGLPCIGGKYDGVKEVVVQGETGLLVEQDPREIAAACLKLLTDDELAAQLGRAGQLRYLHHFQFGQFRQRLLTTLGLTL